MAGLQHTNFVGRKNVACEVLLEVSFEKNVQSTVIGIWDKTGGRNWDLFHGLETLKFQGN